MILLRNIVLFVLLAVAINLPFGSYRTITRKFSLAWWLAIHLPIPLILVVRIFIFGLPVWTIPISLASAVAGQIWGGKFQWFKAKAEAEAAAP